MKSPHAAALPDRDSFASDPIGYSALGWQKWGLAQTVAGFPVDLTASPTREDLNSPVLWLSQARALTEAAVAVIRNQPQYEKFPPTLRRMCDSQYCAVGLMLVGYSLEVCLKGMLIVKRGVQGYLDDEKLLRHHNLLRLAEFIPNLSEKDKAILQALTHFVMWAGRYPDPGSGREGKATEVFELAEQHLVTSKDLFSLAARVMGHVSEVVG